MKSVNGLSLTQLQTLRDNFGSYACALMRYFTNPNAWLGGFYELAILYSADLY
jgi:hypothetical protein